MCSFFFVFHFMFRLKTGYLERGQASRLVIDNVTYDYQGEYECRATNVINGQERTVASEPVSLQVVGECTFPSLCFFLLFSQFFVTIQSENNQNPSEWLNTSKCSRKKGKQQQIKTNHMHLTIKFNPTVTFQLNSTQTNWISNFHSCLLIRCTASFTIASIFTHCIRSQGRRRSANANRLCRSTAKARGMGMGFIAIRGWSWIWYTHTQTPFNPIFLFKMIRNQICPDNIEKWGDFNWNEYIRPNWNGNTQWS